MRIDMYVAYAFVQREYAFEGISEEDLDGATPYPQGYFSLIDTVTSSPCLFTCCTTIRRLPATVHRD